MAKFRLITKKDSEDFYNALILSSSSANEAKEKSKNLISEEEKLVAIDVKASGIWVNIKGEALKGVTLERHPNTEIDMMVSGDSYTREEASSLNSQKSESTSEESGFMSLGGHKSLGATVGKALIQAMVVVFFRVFTIPWVTWQGACYRLAEELDSGRTLEPKRTTEFPIFEWFKQSLDAVIVLSWPIGFLFTLFISINAHRDEASIFLLGMAWTYFGVLGWSLFKETLTLFLSIALNVENISQKSTPEK